MAHSVPSICPSHTPVNTGVGRLIIWLVGRSMALMTSKVQKTVLLGNLCPGWPIDIYETLSHNQFHAITAICGHFHRPASIYKQFPTHQTLKNVCAHITHPSVMAWARHFCAVLSLFLDRVPSIILSLKLIMNHFPAVHSVPLQSTARARAKVGYSSVIPAIRAEKDVVPLPLCRTTLDTVLPRETA